MGISCGIKNGGKYPAGLDYVFFDLLDQILRRIKFSLIPYLLYELDF